MTCCNDTSECKTVRDRVRYFPRQPIGVADMVDEQEHRLARMRWHNRMTHGFGVVCGFAVERARDANGEIDAASTTVSVCPGYALSPQGDEIILEECVTIDVKTGLVKPDPCADAWPCPPVTVAAVGREPIIVYVAVRYAECLARPIRMPPGCGCEEGGCELSRIRASYEIRVLHDLPKSHRDMAQAEEAFVASVKQWKASALAGNLALVEQRHPIPVPPCPPCPGEPWVVLAAIGLRAGDDGSMAITGISYVPRRALWPVWAVQAVAMAM